MNVLVFSGNNDRAIITFCRYATQKDISFSIIANGDEDLIFETVYKKNVVAIRKKNKLDLNFIIENCKKLIDLSSSDKILIVPSTEYLNRFLLENRNLLEVNNIEIGLCEEYVYEKISDKYSFGELCKQYSLKVPNEYKNKPVAYPFVIKAKKYAEGLQCVFDKPALIFDKEQFCKYIKDKKEEDYYYQEYIGGKSFYLLYYIFKGGNHAVYSQENLMQQDNGGSMILCKSSAIHENEIAAKYANLFKKEGFYGLVMVELKYDKEQFYMIEANPRFWGPSQLILDSGMNLFDCFAKENKLIEEISESIYHPNSWYFWSGGITENVKKSKVPIFYDFNNELLLSNYNDISKSDIYLKKDTVKLQIKESLNE